MPEEASKRIVVVTGGSRGLGLAIARRLAAAGYGVVAVARRMSDQLGTAAQEKHSGSLDFVAVSGSEYAMDGSSPASENDVLEWIRRFNVAYPVAFDPLLNVANLYLQGGFPTIAIIGKDKTVAYLNSGELSYQELVEALEKVLR